MVTVSAQLFFTVQKNDTFSIYLLSRVDIVIRYIEVDFTFGLPDYVRYIEEFVISRFYSMHFTITLAGTLIRISR